MTGAVSAPWKYTSVRLQVESIAASLTRGRPIRSRNACPSVSMWKATCSRTLMGAVEWLRPRAYRGMPEELQVADMVAQYGRSCPLDARPALTEVKPPGRGRNRPPAQAGRATCRNQGPLLCLDELL